MTEIPLDHPLDTYWGEHQSFYHYMIDRVEKLGEDAGVQDYGREPVKVEDAPYKRVDYKTAWHRGYQRGYNLLDVAVAEYESRATS